MSRDATSKGLPEILERLSDRAVPGSERWALGLWRLRAGLGATGRANSTWAPGPLPGSVVAAVDAVETWYRERGLTPCFQVFDDGRPALGAELDRRNWPATVDTLVMTASVPVVIAGVGLPTSDDRSVEMSVKSTPSFAALVGDDRRLTEVTETKLPQRIVTITDSGRLRGGGMATVDGRWAAVGAMNTRPEARRQGVASGVLAALAAVSADLGAETMWLQVQSDNHGAVALYRGLGFEVVHRYRYRTAPDR